jgi:hypothetical protein
MTIADKAMAVTGANRGIGQTLVAEAPSTGAKPVDAGPRRRLAHLDGRVTLLGRDVTSTAQIQAAAHQQGSMIRSPPARYEQRATRWSWPPRWRKRCTTGSWTG